MTEEGIPLISEGVVLEIQKKQSASAGLLWDRRLLPIQLWENARATDRIDPIEEIWHEFLQRLPINRKCQLPDRCFVSGDAPEGYSSYFVGQVGDDSQGSTFSEWTLPARDYVVCSFDTISEQLIINMGKAMRYTRFWLKKNGWIAEDFFLSYIKKKIRSFMLNYGFLLKKK